MTSIDTDHYMFDENNGLWVVAPILSLPACYFIGGRLNGKRLARQDKRRTEYNEIVDKEIKICTIHLLDLLGHCGAEAEQFKSNPRISDIMRISFEIERKRSEVLYLEKSKK